MHRILRTLRFLALWCLGELLVFSAISGKQPHYLLPVLPVLVLIFGYFMAKVRLLAIAGTAAFMLALFAIGQVIASATFLYRYDLASTAKFVIAMNRQAELAFAGRYQGELTFLARLDKPLTIVERANLHEWLQEHPAGYPITRALRYPDVTGSVAYSQLVERDTLSVLNEGELSTKHRHEMSRLRLAALNSGGRPRPCVPHHSPSARVVSGTCIGSQIVHHFCIAGFSAMIAASAAKSVPWIFPNRRRAGFRARAGRSNSCGCWPW